MTVKLHPTSAIYGLGYQPEFVVYHELVLTAKDPFMSTVSTADPRWLAAQGGVFYSIKEKGGGAHKEINQKLEIETEIAKVRQKEGEELTKLEVNQQQPPSKGTSIKIVSRGAVRKPLIFRRRAGV